MFEGMLPVRRMRGDWWELGEEGTMLVGARTGGALRLGDPIRVEVSRVDAPRGRVDLLTVEEDDSDGDRGRGAGTRDRGRGAASRDRGRGAR
jgi:hypothetical protein